MADDGLMDETGEGGDLEARGDGVLDISDFFGGGIFHRRDGGIFGRRDAGQGDAGAPAPRDGGTPGSKADAGPQTGSDALWCSVKPIFEKSCTSCHDGQGSGGSPMGLITHADFLAPNPSVPSKKVYEQVGARVHDTARPMPPRGLLPKAEQDAIDAWIGAGAPGSDSTTCGGDSGEQPDPSDGWDPSKCDAVYEIRSHGPGGPNEPYVVGARTEITPNVKVDAPWGDEKVQAIAFRPITDNKKVLHHWILNGAGFTFLAGWAPGDDKRPPFPKDVGMDMPSGRGSMTLAMHYYNREGTTPESDRSGVEVCVLKKNNFRKNLAAVATSFTSIGEGLVLAPRGAVDRPVTATCNVVASQPVHLLTAAPHAHKYATRMKFTVKKKNGQEIVMHDQPFRFGEQGTYPLAGGEVVLENGDQVTTSCYYTNNTNKNITFGESTENEMCFNFALYYPKGALSCGGGLFGSGLLGGR